MKRVRVKRRVGDVVEIHLGDGRRAYGLVLKAPLIAFFDVWSTQRLSVDEILAHPIVFSIWVMYSPINEGEWEVIGHIDVPTSINQRPPFFKKDAITGKLFITHDGAEEIPAALQDVQGMECAAVWSAEHVVERLNDHFAGRPNLAVEQMKPKVGG